MRECVVTVKIDTTKIRDTMQALADKSVELDSTIDLLRFLAQRTLPPNHSKRIFIEWLADNIGDLESAMKTLGIDVSPGRDFAARLEEEVISHLQASVTTIPLDELLKNESGPLSNTSKVLASLREGGEVAALPRSALGRPDSSITAIVSTRRELVKQNVKEKI